MDVTTKLQIITVLAFLIAAIGVAACFRSLQCLRIAKKAEAEKQAAKQAVRTVCEKFTAHLKGEISERALTIFIETELKNLTS
jgi:flagellar basal body-associated protein FliL